MPGAHREQRHIPAVLANTATPAYPKTSLFPLRISLGWLMFYAGITKVLDPSWSSWGYLMSAKTFTGFYH